MYHGPLPKIKEEIMPMETIQVRPGSGRVATFARNIRTAFTAAKAGHTVAPVRQIPVVSFEFWSWTPEVCLDFTRPTRAAVREIFRTFDSETQHRMTFAPKRGELVQRARLWREALKPALPPEQYYEAMLKILGWLIRCSKAVPV